MLRIFLLNKNLDCVEVNTVHRELCFQLSHTLSNLSNYSTNSLPVPAPTSFLKLLWKLNHERQSPHKEASFRIPSALP